MNGQSWFDAVLAFLTGSGVSGALVWLRAHEATIRQVTGKVEAHLPASLDNRITQLESSVFATQAPTAPTTDGTA